MEWFARAWWILLVRGVPSLMLGIAAVLWPNAAIRTEALIFGVFALVDGAGSIALVTVPRSARAGAYLARGLAGVVAGAAAVLSPDLGSKSIVILAGLWGLVAGLSELLFALRLRRIFPGAYALVGAGLLTLVFAVPMILRPPPGAFALIVSVAALAGINGAAAVLAAMTVRGTTATPRAV